MQVLIAGVVLSIALPAAGSPQEEARRDLLRRLGLDAPKKPKPDEPGEPGEPDEPGEPGEPDESPTPPPPSGPDGPTSPSDPTAPPKADTRRTTPYNGKVHALLQKRCASCHKKDGAAGSTHLVLSGEVGTDYRKARALVNLDRPRASKLITKAIGKSHAGGKSLVEGGREHALLLAWIESGAHKGGASKPTPAPVPVPAPAPTPGPSNAAPPPSSGAKPPRGPKSPSPSKPAPSPATAEPGATEPGATEPGATEPATATGLAYAPTVHDLLRARCGACHATGTMASGGAFVLTGDVAADYAVTTALVDVSAPETSRLLTKATGVEHGGGPTLSASSDAFQTIHDWIEGGALGPTAAEPEATPPSPEGEPTTDATAPVPTTDAASSATSPAPTPGHPHGAGGPAIPMPALPYGLRLNGKFDFSYERRDYRGHPFGPGSNAFRTYHHFLFLSRSGADDPFGFNIELLTQAFYEFNARVAPKGRRFSFLFKAGKIMVPFGPEPLFHKSYGGRSGFDQEILPTIWALPGIAATTQVRLGPVTLLDDLYAVQGYGLRASDAVLNLQGDVSTLEQFHIAAGNRVGVAWRPLTAWYSAQLNPLGFDRLLFMQALDLEFWRMDGIPVLEDLVLGLGAMRADVSGAGAGQDYYHFGSYGTVGYYPIDRLYIQYRGGLRTTDNRRGAFFDDTRLDERDRGSHNVTVMVRHRGLYAGLQMFWNLERANELDDDYLRLTVGYEF